MVVVAVAVVVAAHLPAGAPLLMVALHPEAGVPRPVAVVVALRPGAGAVRRPVIEVAHRPGAAALRLGALGAVPHPGVAPRHVFRAVVRAAHALPALPLPSYPAVGRRGLLLAGEVPAEADVPHPPGNPVPYSVRVGRGR